MPLDYKTLHCRKCSRVFSVLRPPWFPPECLGAELYLRAARDDAPHISVLRCPRCHHVDWATRFPPAQLLAGIATSAAAVTSRDLEAFAIALAGQGRNEEAGWAYLQSAWMSQGERAPDHSRRLLERAVRFLIRGWESNQIAAKGEAAVLISKLCRTLNRKHEAATWDGRARSTPPLGNSSLAVPPEAAQPPAPGGGSLAPTTVTKASTQPSIGKGPRAYWFRPIHSTRKCPCGHKNTQVWSRGEYVRATWSNPLYFCRYCFKSRMLDLLPSDEKCVFLPCTRPLPEWLTRG